MNNIKILGFSISSYWGMLYIAIAVAMAISLLRRNKYGFCRLIGMLITLLLIFYGCAGAKLLYMIENPKSTFTPFGGMSFFGSVFFIPLAMFITALVFRLSYLGVMDYCTLYVPMVLAFMRIGCFLNECCGGRDLILFGQAFTPPVQLIECVFDLIIMAMLIYLNLKPLPKGQLYPCFMIMYSALRFILEFIRTGKPIILFLTKGQILSLASIAIGLITIKLINKRSYHHEQNK